MKYIPYIIVSLLLTSALYLWYHSNKRPSVKPEKTHVIIVGTNAEFPPFTFVKNDTIVGFDIDIAREVCKRLGKEIELHDMPYEALLPEIQLGKIQMIAAGMTPTEQRAKKILFTKPHFDGDPLVIVSLANKPLATIAALKGKEVVVNQGYTADMFMSDIKGIQLTRLPAPAESFLALKKGRADAFVTAKSTVRPFFEQYDKADFNVAQIPDTTESAALGISKKYPELLPEIQKALNAIKEDGTLTKLKKKWNLL